MSDPTGTPPRDQETRSVEGNPSEAETVSLDSLHARLNQQVAQLEKLELRVKWVETQVAIQTRPNPTPEEL